MRAFHVQFAYAPSPVLRAAHLFLVDRQHDCLHSPDQQPDGSRVDNDCAIYDDHGAARTSVLSQFDWNPGQNGDHHTGDHFPTSTDLHGLYLDADARNPDAHVYAHPQARHGREAGHAGRMGRPGQ